MSMCTSRSHWCEEVSNTERSRAAAMAIGSKAYGAGSDENHQKGREPGRAGAVAKGSHGRSVGKMVDMRRETCVGFFR